jgi:hypothetical protein
MSYVALEDKQHKTPTGRTCWLIGIKGRHGTLGRLAGWEDIRFHSYARCMEAIQFIEENGPDIRAYLSFRRSN